jgi:hypothetical protein
MRTGVPCNENRFFPVRIDLQGVPCKPYRVWVCSVVTNRSTSKLGALLRIFRLLMIGKFYVYLL